MSRFIYPRSFHFYPSLFIFPRFHNEKSVDVHYFYRNWDKVEHLENRNVHFHQSPPQIENPLNSSFSTLDGLENEMSSHKFILNGEFTWKQPWVDCSISEDCRENEISFSILWGRVFRYGLNYYHRNDRKVFCCLVIHIIFPIITENRPSNRENWPWQ